MPFQLAKGHFGAKVALMKITLDLKGTSATAIMTTLKLRQAELEEELADVNSALQQLEKLGNLPLPEKTEGGNVKHGQTEKAVMDYLITVASPYEASEEQLTEHLGTTRTTTRRALMKLVQEGKIRRTTNGNWIIKQGPIETHT